MTTKKQKTNSENGDRQTKRNPTRKERIDNDNDFPSFDFLHDEGLTALYCSDDNVYIDVQMEKASKVAPTTTSAFP
jgi:hypothetical protein